MSVSLSTFQAWLKNQAAIRCVLVEVDVKTSGGSLVTRYFSNAGYVTAPGDTPANTIYYPYVSGGVKFTESLSLDGSFSLSYGDIELNNVNGELDSYLNDYWSNRRIKVYIGDKTWVRDDFWLVFDGMTTGIDSRKRDTINIKVSDKLQRLNFPVTEASLGGSTANADKLLPVCFGECHNVEPLLVDPANHEYAVHNGAVEDIIEVRDNGVPVTITKLASTGRFRLSASPAGQITASVQGAANRSNLALQSNVFNVAPWSILAITTSNNTSSVPAPDGTNTSTLVAETTANSNHYTSQSFTTVAGQTYTVSCYIRGRGAKQYIRLSASSGAFWANFDFINGVFATTNGLVTPYAASVGNGWYRLSITFVATGTASDISIALLGAGQASTYTGVVTDGMFLWRAQAELGVVATQYQPTVASAASIYLTSVVNIIKSIVTQWGNATTRFTAADLDLTSLEQFDLANTQQVGIYLSERTNVLDAINQLAGSLGARVAMSRSGQLRLVKVTLPQSTTGTAVSAADMADRSLYVSALAPVKAGCQIGYCKNWKTQDNIALGVTESHADLFRQEYLTISQTDSTAAANFNLYVEPVMEPTLLLVGADASTEATRRLNVYNVQRKQLKYKGYGNLMLETLGNPQTITHSRYGLSGGVTGQIIGITTDWLSQKAEIEVLI